MSDACRYSTPHFPAITWSAPDPLLVLTNDLLRSRRRAIRYQRMIRVMDCVSTPSIADTLPDVVNADFADDARQLPREPQAPQRGVTQRNTGSPGCSRCDQLIQACAAKPNEYSVSSSLSPPHCPLVHMLQMVCCRDDDAIASATSAPAEDRMQRLPWPINSTCPNDGRFKKNAPLPAFFDDRIPSSLFTSFSSRGSYPG